MLLRSVVVVWCTVAVASTANAQQPTPTRACSVKQIDSTRVGSAPVYRDCDVDKPAKLRREQRVRFEFPRELTCATVDLEFVVDSTGKPVAETVALIATNAREFGVRVIQSLPQWQYEPAQLGGRPVAQMVALRHAMPDGRMPFVVAGQPAPPPRPTCR